MKAVSTEQLIGLIVLSVLGVLISVYDIRHTVIPDAWSYAFAAAAFGFRLPEIIAGTTSIQNVVFGGVCLSAGLWLIWFVSRGRWLGFGDVKLIFGVGVLLGVFGAVISLWLACMMGSFVGIYCIVMQKVRARGAHMTLQSQLAFGPFILLGVALILFEFVSISRLWHMLYII
jgi:prepilin signal peptidase PulO-like enzyme (type II secretory pathway)